MCEVGGGVRVLGDGLAGCWVSRSSKRMPPEFISLERLKLYRDVPGKRCESLIRNIRAKSGKWFRHASKVSNAAFNEMIAMRAQANVR